jgi:hypothetical protein
VTAAMYPDLLLIDLVFELKLDFKIRLTSGEQVRVF